MKQFIPFSIVPSNRSYTRDKDSLLLNCFIERQGETLTLVKRPGFNLAKDVSGTISVANTRGMIWCAAHSKYYLCINQTVYSISSDLATITEIISVASALIDTTSGKVYFDVMNDGGVAVVMLAIPKINSTLSQLFKITNGTPSVAAEITDADYPTNCVGGGVVFNNYYYVLAENTTAGTRKIHGSDLNTPSSWNALNSIAAQEYPDSGVSLVRFNNQLACFKDYTTEFFYDAGNPIGSPLSKTTNATLNIGCASAESIIVADNNMLWLSRDQNSGLAVHMLSGGQLQKISTSFIDKTLASVEAIIQEHKVNSFFLTYEGHRFYGLSIEGTSSTSTALVGSAVVGIAIVGTGAPTSHFKRTFVYDLTENLWHEWSTNNGSDTQISFFANTVLSGAPAASNDYTNTLAVDTSNGNIYTMSPEPIGTFSTVTYKDGTKLIRCEIVTNIFDGGIQDKKRCNSLELIGDRTISTSNISVYYTDDDYQNYNGPRTIDMNKRARVRNLGSFEQRAFKFVHESDTPMRLRGFEIDIEKGSW